MGFWKKTWNWLTGKGFKEEEEIDTTQQEQQTKELQEAEETSTPQEETQQEEQIQKEEKQRFEPPKPQYKEPQKKEEVKTATKRFEQSGNIEKIQERLTEGVVSSVQFTPTKDLSSLRGVYNNLLRKSTISVYDKYGNEDQALLEVLVQNRNKLQHRFSGEIIIITNGTQGRMTIDGVLAEHLSDINDFIQEGMTYTSEELKKAMGEAMAYFEKQYGSIGGNIQAPPETKSTIQQIQVKLTFA